MDFQKFKEPTFDLTRPVKPALPTKYPTKEQIAAYQVEVERYSLDKQQFDEARLRHESEIANIRCWFEREAMEEVFSAYEIQKFPNTVNWIWQKAWEQKNNGGLPRVFSTLQDLSEILMEVKKDLTGDKK